MRLKHLISATAGILLPSLVLAQSQGTYYDSFYNDYAKTYQIPPSQYGNSQYIPPANVQIGKPPATATQTPANNASNLASFSKSVEHKPGIWEGEARYKMSEGQFMFETDVGSILNWDESISKEFELKLSRDFLIKDRQYVFNASYSSGSMTTERTSDDDIFNELHIISLGTGSASMSSWSAGIGIRNWKKFGNWDLTPSVGWKQKSQKFEMADHVAPAPFYFDEWCYPLDDGSGLCSDIDLYWDDLAPLQDYLYIVDSNGNTTRPTTVAEWDDVTYIPAVGKGGVVNLAYRMLVPDEDFCWVTMEGRTACVKEVDIYGYNNVSYLFGGVSAINDQRGKTTHKYYVTWAGPYLGLNLERALSPIETLSLYGEVFKPTFRAEGDWPLRDDWMHDPSFIDDGGSAWGFSGELEYKYALSPKSALTLGVSYEYIQEKNADTTLFFADDRGSPAGSEVYPSAIYTARWKNATAFVGFAFTL